MAVVGDSLLDVYYTMEATEWDAGLLAYAYRVVGGHTCLGGAANVAAATAATGAAVTLFSVVGEDTAGAALRSLLDRWGVDGSGILHDEGYHTRVLTRLQGQGAGLPVRLDYCRDLPLLFEDGWDNSREAMDVWQGVDDAALSSCDGIVIADYGGLMTGRSAQELIGACVRLGVPTFVDPSRGRVKWYRGCTVVKLNLKEATRRVSHEALADTSAIAHHLRILCQAEVAIVTLSEEGVLAVSSDQVVSMPSLVAAEDVVNATGAGDAFAAGFMADYCQTKNLEEAVSAGLLTASLAVMTECTCPQDPQMQPEAHTISPVNTRQRLTGVNIT